MATGRDIYRKGRLTAIPGINGRKEEACTGLFVLPMESVKPVLFYVPSGYHPEKGAALAVMLHGADGNAEHGMHLLQQYADAHNILLLAPASKE